MLLLGASVETASTREYCAVTPSTSVPSHPFHTNSNHGEDLRLPMADCSSRTSLTGQSLRQMGGSKFVLTWLM